MEIVSPPIGDLKTKEGLRTVFRHLDKDEDDIINFEELKQLARLAGDNINDEDIMEMLHSVFINKNTSTNEGIYFDEFYQMVTKFNKK